MEPVLCLIINDLKIIKQQKTVWMLVYNLTLLYYCLYYESNYENIHVSSYNPKVKVGIFSLNWKRVFNLQRGFNFRY